MNNKTWGIILIIVAIIAVGAFFFAEHTPITPNPSPYPSPTPTSTVVEYRNTQYGFVIPLPESWKGYTVLNKTWQGQPVTSGTSATSGPLIVLRHPKWSAAASREDMPIMVFTPQQWNLVLQEKLAVGAAPIPPSKLGENSNYIFALPARYNYDYKTGWEEVDQIVHTLQTF